MCMEGQSKYNAIHIKTNLKEEKMMKRKMLALLLAGVMTCSLSMTVLAENVPTEMIGNGQQGYVVQEEVPQEESLSEEAEIVSNQTQESCIVNPEEAKNEPVDDTTKEAKTEDTEEAEKETEEPKGEMVQDSEESEEPDKLKSIEEFKKEHLQISECAVMDENNQPVSEIEAGKTYIYKTKILSTKEMEMKDAGLNVLINSNVWKVLTAENVEMKVGDSYITEGDGYTCQYQLEADKDNAEMQSLNIQITYKEAEAAITSIPILLEVRLQVKENIKEEQTVVIQSQNDILENSKIKLSIAEKILVEEETTDKTSVANSFRWKGSTIVEYTGTGGAVTIPSNCTAIGDYAFSGEGGITSVTIPASVKEIGYSAFQNCYGITRVNLAPGVVTIGNYAFASCTGLKAISIPATVRTIGSYAFNSCTGVTSLTLAEGVTKIRGYAFAGTNISSVAVPNSVTEMEGDVFSYCHALTSVSVGNGLAVLPSYTFYKCSALKTVHLGNRVNAIGSYAFYECESLQSITIPTSVKRIGNSAFRGAKKLTTLSMGNGVQQIEDYAFYGCTSLKNISWSNALTTIGGDAFNSVAISTLTLPSTVATVKREAFSYCTSLKTVNLSSSLTSISNSMFYGCSALTTVTGGNALTEIGSSAFRGCISLASISIPDSVTCIRYSAFRDCASLKSLIIGNGVTKIESYAFADCISLQKLVMSYGATVIDQSIVNSSNNVVVYVYKDSYGYQWVRDNNIRYSVMNIFAPSPVSNLRAVSAGKNKVRISWSASAYADGYIICAQKGGKYAKLAHTVGTTYLDTKALDADYNYYWVFPYIKDNSGVVRTGGCTKYVFAKGICAAVTNLKAASVTGGVRLNWSKAADAQGYLIYGIRPGGKYSYIGMTTSGTNFTDKKASKTSYNYYWVYPYHKNASGKMVVGGTAKYVYGRAR